MKKGLFCRAAVLGVALAAGSQASAITLYEIQKVGLYDLEHTYSAGSWSNQYRYFNSAGQVVGTSYRYFGGTTNFGQSAWIHSGGATQRIGLTDAGHTSNNGSQYNTVAALGGAGHVIGQANRYIGGVDAGRSAWIYDGNSTQEIGLAGSEHTYTGSGTAYIANFAQFVNHAGDTAGRANRYNGSASMGYSAWLYSGGTTQKIGLTSGAHTRADGYQNNIVRKLNNSGQAVGQAARFDPSSQYQYGQSAWLHTAGTTQQIGLSGTGFVSNAGRQWNDVWFLNDAGQAVGRAERYSTGGDYRGNAAWLHSGNTTQQIGLVGAEHTYLNGHQENSAVRMNEAGHVAGVAAWYAGGGQSAWLYRDGATKEIGLTGPGYDSSTYGRYNEVMLLNGSGQVAGRSQINGYYGGYRTWLYNGSTTQQIGLTGVTYTNSSTGYQLNEVLFLNESGYAAGRATRFDGSQSKGMSTWIFNGSATVEIGLTDAAHTTNGIQYNQITHLNARGQAAGNAQRFTDSGASAWFYDPLSNVTYNMSEYIPSGKVSFIDVLSDDGLALGSYYDSAIGSRAFAFSVENGWHDLGSLVEGGLGEEGWSYLEGAYGAGANDILGYGKIGSAGALYLLTPVPEADTWALFLAGLALVGAAVRRHRKGGFEAPLCV